MVKVDIIVLSLILGKKIFSLIIKYMLAVSFL